ncbi:MAG: histidine--tRNA ligase [Candidatus Kerfeldbacteria bacterium]|nr:histidine--tRNA ligase [Candidatus Kerfeldbacteria bacterium]
MPTIEPRTLKGFRDFLPQDAIRRQRVIRTIAETYESYGFSPLETPALEYGDVLTGKYGDEGEKLMYRFRDQGGRDVALRYDLTVPLARVVAQYLTLPKPFRRYQIAPVWRAENTQKGRYREFTQCDIDVVGTSSMTADAEIIQVIAAVLTNLGFSKFEVRINNRKLLNGILDTAGVPPEKTLATIRSLDKWLKIGADGVRAELADRLATGVLDRLFELLPQSDEDSAAWTARTEEVLSTSKAGKAGLEELDTVMKILAAAPFQPQIFRLDPLLSRGLDYYTGTVFEATLTDKPEFGSVFGGGRYDKLVGQFIGSDVPAVGASAGIDRILGAMEELGMNISRGSVSDVLVLMMDEAFVFDTAALAGELRAAGIKTEMYDEPVKLDKQLKYADQLGIPFAILYGSREKEQEMVTIKNLAKKKQETVKRPSIVQELKRRLT